MTSRICPTCSCTEIDVVDVSGESVCVSCGTILEENNIVSTVEFHESASGAHSVTGRFVSATASKAYGNVGTSGRNYGNESRASTLANSKKIIRHVAGLLRLGDHYVDSSFRLYALALQRNFTRGRRMQTVIAACLYVVCRRERSPHLLIDFSDKLQINVYVLGGVFLKFCKLLQIHLPLIDPSLYIHRFAAQLNFAGKTHSIATTALRLTATMKRDWIETGRRPSGICGAALLIAARSQSVMCSLHDVMDVVNIGERTLKQRLYEFSLTPTAQLTYDQVGKIEMSRVACDPPSFQRHREKEVMKLLLLESEKLPSEMRKGKRLAGRQKNGCDGSEYNDDKSPVLTKSILKETAMRMEDQEMSLCLTGGGLDRRKQMDKIAAGTDFVADPRYRKPDEQEVGENDDEDIDYGFDNANDQIVNRASRLAAQEVLLRVRKKSARYIMRKRDEAELYKTIERDLTLAIEEDSTSANASRIADNREECTVTKRRRSRDFGNVIQEKKRRSRLRSASVGHEDDADESNGAETRVEKQKVYGTNELEKEAVDTLSDLDDDEINSLLLTQEEADTKKLLWEKMNKEFIHEQEQKRLLGLSAPITTKKKRKKKLSDENAPPPDTAQHAIYKLKSRRINYEVIDELFGEAASNGF